MSEGLRIRVIIPAHNAAWCIQACLSGLFSAGFERDEIILVDDMSTDTTTALARQTGVTVVSQPSHLGAAAARNRGARDAETDILFFVDADVVVHSDVRERLLDFFRLQPGIDAVFGAYDDKPSCPSLTSKYRNLLHHYVHCQGPERPSSFWTGCGAVLRTAFERLEGFDERQRMMEDVEFGMRLKQAGGVVALYSRLQGKHLKSWSVFEMARADLFDRAIPWSRLMLFGPGLSKELNMNLEHRLSAVLTVLIAVGVACTPLAPAGLALTAASSAAFLAVNRDFFLLVRRCAGRRAALAAIPLHVVHYACAVTGLGWVFATEYLPRRALSAVMPTHVQSRKWLGGRR